MRGAAEQGSEARTGNEQAEGFVKYVAGFDVGDEQHIGAPFERTLQPFVGQALG